MKDYTILYVDDEQANLNAIKSLFRKKFNIITANSAQEGLEILEHEAIHLIVADQRMPQMTGVQFLKKVKETRPDIKSILLTAYHDDAIIKEAVNDAGIFWYMNKPFENEKLELVIKKGLESYHDHELIKKSEEKFRGVFESIIDVFVRRTLDGKILLVSPSIFDLIGYTSDELLHKNLSSYHVSGTLANEIAQSLLKHGGVQYFEPEVTKKDGSVITIASRAKLFYDNDGTPIGVESVFRDITESKNAEKKINETQQRLKNLTNQLTLSEEKMRKQIAVDLHDDVGQLISSSRMQLSVIDLNEDNALIQNKINDISKSLLQATKATREVIFNLSPPQLNEISLFAAIHDWAKEEVERKHKIRTIITKDKEIYNLDENTRFLLFRSVKELLVNIIKHAKASFVKIRLLKRNKSLIIVVKDDGVGFDYNPDNPSLPNSSYGLFSTNERILNLGGSMSIVSRINFGTEVKLEVPID